MARPSTRLGVTILIAGILLVSIFILTLVRFRSELRDETHRTIIERAAAVLQPMALQEVADSETRAPDDSEIRPHLFAVLKSVRQKGVLLMSIFDADGSPIESVPHSRFPIELSADDYVRLLANTPVSRYHPEFPREHYLPDVPPDQRHAPVLEVIIPLHRRASDRIVGFARYYLDGVPLSKELSVIDHRINRTTGVSLALGSGLIAAVIGAAYLLLRRAQRTIAERNERLARANFELTLAAKASALGQITSHLIHGLQGPVAGLRAVVGNRESATPSDWQSAADYTDRLQAIIGETVALLSDVHAQATYELTASELASTIHDRNRSLAGAKGVRLVIETQGQAVLDSHRGSLLCLIATNLIHNAVCATPAGGTVQVIFDCSEKTVTLTVVDTGTGIAPTVRDCLFQPGRSGRPGGTGLGLAISQLLARQIGAELALVNTGPQGTTFRLTGPLSQNAL